LSDNDPSRDTTAPPFELGVSLPERYSGGLPRYISRGGMVRPPEDVRGFLADENNSGDLARFYGFSLIFDQILKEDLQGDIAELGVYKGHTASLLAIMARRLGRTAYLLDTFTGFDEADLKGMDAGISMSFADTSIEAVRQLVGEQNVTFVPGYFPATTAQLPPYATYCLVHIDCDLYAPMRSALEYFYPRLVPGGFLILHDYSSLSWSGAERAIDEFFSGRTESVTPMPDRQGSAVVRKVRHPTPFDNWFVQWNARSFRSEWAEAGEDKLFHVLGNGWSRGEDWGVWGVDEVHQIFVFLNVPPTRDIELEFDLSAMLMGDPPRREIDVRVSGQILQTWIFTNGENRNVRDLRIPLTNLAAADACSPMITVEICPRLVAAACDLYPDIQDTRKLGVALHKLRRVS
jgi:hypothetical protein